MTDLVFSSSDFWIVFSIIFLTIFAMLVIVGLEAFEQSSATKVEALSEKSPKRAINLGKLLADAPSSTNRLKFIALGLQFAQVSLVAYLAFKFFEGPWYFLVIASNVLLMVLLTETIPRSFGYANSDSVSLALAGPLHKLSNILPVRVLSMALLKITDLSVPGRELRYVSVDSPEEIVAIADAAVEDKVIEPEERDLIESIIEFGDTIVREVMVPRPDMKTVSQGTGSSDALELASEFGFSRIPVVGETSDEVIGLAYVKDLIKAELADGADVPVERSARKPVFVPETKKVAELLKEMQKNQFHMAIAVDEYGGIAGLVTLEDLIEEIVGEIVDEYDTEEPMFDRLRDGSFRVDARIPIDEINDLGAIELPEGAWDTVGGLVFDSFGRVPSVGEEIVVEGHSLFIERVQGRRISRVRLRKLPDSEVSRQNNE